MPEATSIVAAWSSFYVIAGSSSATLTGLMFVVITLVPGADRTLRKSEGISMFSTPTVVHFSAAFLISTVLSAPWTSLHLLGAFLSLLALCVLVYLLWITYRMTKRTIYKPDVEDWLSYTILPLIAYGTLFVAAVILSQDPVDALFAFAAATMLLIFIGIHNAWDIVTFIALDRGDEPTKEG